MIKINPISALKDNYIWAIVNIQQQSALIVDPGEAAPVLNYLKNNHLRLDGILITHHHWDHVNGAASIIAQHPAPVFGSEICQYSGLTQRVTEKTPLKVNEHFPSFNIIKIPGHTLDHIAYFTQEALFCGDTLFTAGCGRLFEGTAEQMYSSLQKLAALPEQTPIYCGHEYTLSNLQFAQAVEPNNPQILERIQQVNQLRKQGLPTVPATLLEEKQTNPFLRCQSTELIQQVEKQVKRQLNTPIEVFKELREWKNNF